MSKSSAENNRSLAEDLLRAGQEWRARQPEKLKPPEIAPEVVIRQQIEATKRRGLETGQDVKPRLLELRMRHRDITGEDGG